MRIWPRYFLFIGSLILFFILLIFQNSCDATEISKSEFYKTKAFGYLSDALPASPFKYYTVNGVPYVKRGNQYLIHPVLIEQRMLQYHGSGFPAGDRENKAIFKKIMNNIIDSKTINDPSGKIVYGFEFVAGRYEYHFKPGWASAMGQGQMLSLLARTYLDYPDMREKIKKYGNKIMQPLEKQVKDGGLTFHVEINGVTYPFYAEYPAKTHAPLTLNGFMFTLIGIHEYAVVTGSDLAARLWTQGINTLLNILPYYDTYPISTYDLSYITFPHVLAQYSLGYHTVHIEQLDYLYKQTKQPLFACIRDSMARKKKEQLAAHDGTLDNFYFKDHYEAPRWDPTCTPYLKNPADIYKYHKITAP